MFTACIHWKSLRFLSDMILYSRERRMEGVGYGLGTSLPPRGVGKARGKYRSGQAWALQLLLSGLTLSSLLLTFLILTRALSRAQGVWRQNCLASDFGKLSGLFWVFLCIGSTYTVVISKARCLTFFLINTIENLQNKAYLFSIPLF